MPSFLGHPRSVRASATPIFATWNSQGTNPNISLTSGNLTAELTGSPPTTAYNVSATTGYNFDDGKRYVEIEIDNIAGAVSGISVGFADSEQALGLELGDLQYAYAWRADGYKESNGSALPLGTAASNGAIVQMAIHAFVVSGSARAKIWFGKNGEWFGGGDPSQGINPAFVDVIAPIATDWGIRASLKAVGDRIIANFGATPFAYSIPAGFEGGWGRNLN